MLPIAKNKTSSMIGLVCRILLILLLVECTYSSCNPTNCHACQGNDDNICVNCNSGYNEIRPICCHQSCSNCTDSGGVGICTACVNFNFGPKSSDQKCYLCSSYMTNCITCTSQTVCTLCIALFAFNGSQCQLCSTIMPECYNCTSATVCTQCVNDTLAIDPSTDKCVICESLLTGCTNCNSSTICTVCINNTFTLNTATNKCDKCESILTACSTCSSNTSCTTCLNDSYAINSSSLCAVCSTMLTDCLTCNSSSICTSCVNDTVTIDTSNNHCVACSTLMIGCTNCNSSTICTKCINTTYALNTGNNSCDTCLSIMSGCLTCNSTTECLTCVNTTFAVNSTLQCAPCSTIMTDCVTCDSATVCTSCVNDTVTVDPSTFKCVTCITVLTECLTCNSSAICTSCVNTTFALNPSSNLCVMCSSAISYCQNCTSFTICTVCINNSFAINSTSGCSTCKTLISNCLYCNSSTVCTDCISNSYVINYTSNLCVVCSAYINYCSKCDSTTICTKCEINPNIILSNSSCVKCGVVIPNCLNCTADAKCTVCDKYYLPTSSGSCILCQNIMSGCAECTSTTVCTKCGYGHIVLNGCSSVPGCTAIIANNYPKSICTACDQTYYYPQPVNGACICLKGHLAGEYCTEMLGCTKIARTNGIQTCTACDASNKFIPQNGTCICQPNYTINGSTCSQICGDGKQIYLPCDDGNLLNEDGCSSTCQVQKRYACRGGSLTNPSSCIYGGLVKLKPVCVYNLQGNIAQIVLTTTPYISNILKSTLNITFNISKNCSLVSTSLVGQNIILEVSYQQNIQGEYANITIQYDQNYIISPEGSSSFQLKQCNGDRLYYSTNTSKGMKNMINLIVNLLAALVLLVWALGSYSHKMIGVETLHTFQFIFVPHAIASRYFPVIVYFSELSNALNFYQNKITSQTPLTSKEQNRLNYSADFIYNDSVVTFVQILTLVIYAIFFFYGKMKAKSPQLETLRKKRIKMKNLKEDCIENISKFKQFIYDFLIFPSFIGFFLNLALSLMIHSNATYQKKLNPTIQTLLISFSIICVSIIYFNQWKHFLIKDKQYKQANNKQNYVPFYLTNFLILCIVLQASILSLISNPSIVLFAFFFVYTVILIIYRPYHHFLHNISIVINQIGVLLNLCWIISQEFIYLSKQYQELIAFLLIIWMIIILVLAIVRIIYEIWQKKLRTLQKNKLQRSGKNKQDFKQYQARIINSIIKQTLKISNSYFVQSQLLCSKLLQQRQLNQRRKQHIQNLNRAILNSDGEQHDQIRFSPLKKILKMAQSQQQLQ